MARNGPVGAACGRLGAQRLPLSLQRLEGSDVGAHFHTGIVRKRLGLNLVSGFGGKGWVYESKPAKLILLRTGLEFTSGGVTPLFTPSAHCTRLISRFLR
jgi:hypothetical protein